MKRTPLVYSAVEIKQWATDEEYTPGKWAPSRPIGFSGWRYLRMRISIAWDVFVGKYDALNWNGDRR